MGHTDLEKVKSLHTRTVPKVEKAVRELENTLQQYSRICDPINLDDLSDQVDAATEEATKFVDNIAALYNKNEGYAPGLSGHEKAKTDIKAFTEGSDITIVEFLEKFTLPGRRRSRPISCITIICQHLSKLRLHRFSRTMMHS